MTGARFFVEQLLVDHCQQGAALVRLQEQRPTIAVTPSAAASLKPR
jgi:hypothetical protein